MPPTLESLASGLESLALTLLPSPRSNPDAVLGEYGARLDSFGLTMEEGRERPPLRDGLIAVETAIGNLRRRAAHFPTVPVEEIRQAEDSVSRMVAILSAHTIGLPAGIETQLGFGALATAGHLRRLRPWAGLLD